ncbi:MAG: glycine/betaine ABC transporter substrate-binding protein, partial [Actinomycetes bacterium]
MRTRTGLLAAVTASALILAGCSSGTSEGEATVEPTVGATGGTTAQECQPVPGDALVVLSDDKMLQNSDNMIPAINADAATPALIAALDAVSAVLTTDDLIQLNKA